MCLKTFKNCYLLFKVEILMPDYLLWSSDEREHISLKTTIQKAGYSQMIYSMQRHSLLKLIFYKLCDFSPFVAVAITLRISMESQTIALPRLNLLTYRNCSEVEGFSNAELWVKSHTYPAHR